MAKKKDSLKESLPENDTQVKVEPTEPTEATGASKARIKEFVEGLMAKSSGMGEMRMDKYGFGAWSYSKMNKLRKCPLNFYLDYVLKEKVPEDIGGARDMSSADIGSSGHRVLELVMGGTALESAYATAKTEFVPSKLSEEQWENNVVTMHTSIVAFKERMNDFGRRYPIKRVLTERKLGVTKDWKACSFFDKNVFYRGIVDLALELKDGTTVILDHKNAVGFTPISTKNYDSQLNSYKPLLHFGGYAMSGSQAGIHAINAGKVIMGPYHTKSEIEGKLRDELDWEISGNVDRVVEMGNFAHVVNSSCKYCDWAGLCKSKEKYLKPLELGTKKVIPLVQV